MTANEGLTEYNYVHIVCATYYILVWLTFVLRFASAALCCCYRFLLRLLFSAATAFFCAATAFSFAVSFCGFAFYFYTSRFALFSVLLFFFIFLLNLQACTRGLLVVGVCVCVCVCVCLCVCFVLFCFV